MFGLWFDTSGAFTVEQEGTMKSLLKVVITEQCRNLAVWFQRLVDNLSKQDRA